MSHTPHELAEEFPEHGSTRCTISRWRWPLRRGFSNGVSRGEPCPFIAPRRELNRPTDTIWKRRGKTRMRLKDDNLREC